jgi:DNA-binding IclR family transcriptional regulator
MSMSEMESKNSLFVGSLEKGMKILQAFSCGEHYLGLSDFTHLTGMNKSAVQRFAYTWENLGYLFKDPKTKRYCLTPKSIDIVYSFLRSNPLIEIATPRLVNFKNKHGMTINLSVIEGLDTLYILRIPSHNQPLEATLTGRRVPAYCSSGARAMMAHMPETRVDDILNRSDRKKITPYTITDIDLIKAKIEEIKYRGFAINKEECLIDEIVISSAVVNSRGEPIAAIHVPVPSSEWSEEKLIKNLSSDIIAVARSIRCL